MSVRASALVAAGALLLAPAAGRACSVCGSGDPLTQAGDSTPRAGALRLSLEAELLDADARMDAMTTESMAQQTVRPVIVFSPHDALNLVLQVPFVRKDMTMSMMDAADRHVSAGLGDLDLGARWFAWQKVSLGAERRQSLAFTFGSSLPTGGNEATDVGGMRLMEHSQLGSGAFGPYLGVFYAFAHADATITASATARAHTMNAHGYRYGAATMFGVAGQQQVTEWLALGLGLDGHWATNDTMAGMKFESSGGFLISATPQAAVAITRKLWLDVRAQVPFAHHLYGEQRVGPVFTAALQYAAF